jgi:hypothetical protein
MAMDTNDTTKGHFPGSPEMYFWNRPTEECAYELWTRIEGYYNEMRRTGRFALYRNSYTNFYMGWIYRAAMYKSGEMGELTRSFWNHERNILLHLKNQTVQNKLSYKAQVLNSNASSAQTRVLVDGLATHFEEDQRYKLDARAAQSVEDALVFGESSVAVLWNKALGAPMMQDDDGSMLNEGDVEYVNVTPMDLILNTTHQDRTMVQWKIVRRWVNKYDLAAQFPDQHDKLVNMSDTESSYGTKLVTLIIHDNETIPVFYCFHEKSPAVPEGRFLLMADPSTILVDGSLEDAGYDEIPVYDNVPNTMAGSPYGYTVAFDLIPLQQGLNELISSVTSNNINFATQCVMAPKGSNLHYQSLATGMTFIEWDPKMGPNGKPEPLNLLHSAPETYQFMDLHVKTMETLAGVSAMDRGQPDASITSGQYAALITTNSVLFQQPLQRAYANLCEDVMNGTIKILKRNMKTDRVVQIIGENNASCAQNWGPEDLGAVTGVTVELINPMLQTPSGKMQLADVLMKTGLIKDAQQYIGVYADGDLPQLYHRQDTQLILVKQENEALMSGKNFLPAITDNHVMHILEHTANIDTMDARLNPNQPYVIGTLNHIQAHINMMTTINPVLAGIIGDPTLPPGTPSQLQIKAPPPPQPGMQGAPQSSGNPGQVKPPMPGAGPAKAPAPAVQQNRQPGGPTQAGAPVPNQGAPAPQMAAPQGVPHP